MCMLLFLAFLVKGLRHIIIGFRNVHEILLRFCLS
jgi:hypothetical protein